MNIKNIFRRAMVKLNPDPVMREIGNMCKVEFAGNRVFVGLKIPTGGLIPRQAQSAERRQMFAKLQQNLGLLGFEDVELDSAAKGAFSVDSVFVPIDMEKHAANRKIMQKMMEHTDYARHSHNKFPRDWQS